MKVASAACSRPSFFSSEPVSKRARNRCWSGRPMSIGAAHQAMRFFETAGHLQPAREAEQIGAMTGPMFSGSRKAAGIMPVRQASDTISSTL